MIDDCYLYKLFLVVQIANSPAYSNYLSYTLLYDLRLFRTFQQKLFKYTNYLLKQMFFYFFLFIYFPQITQIIADILLGLSGVPAGNCFLFNSSPMCRIEFLSELIKIVRIKG